MTQIIYTALRKLTGGTPANATATFDIGISEYNRARAVIRDAPRAKGGAREVLYHRADVTHSITFQPVNGADLKKLEEFLASTESGETFQIYLYGTEALPLSVYRSDEGNQLNPFMPAGSELKDYWQASITAMEV